MSLDRSTYIGGSDAAALAGEHKYKNIHAVWERLNGRTQPKLDNGHIDRGNELEPLIEDLVRRNDAPDINSQQMYDVYDDGDDSGQILLRHPDHDGMGGHPDGIDSGDPFTSYNVLWEFKSPSSFGVKKIKRNGLPPRYWYQVQWYMHIGSLLHSLPFANVCIWDCDNWNNPMVYQVKYAPDVGEALESVARDLLFAKEMGVDSITDEDFPFEVTPKVDNEQLDQCLAEYQEVKDIERDMKEERQRLKSKILTLVGDREEVTTENNRATVRRNVGQYDATYLTVSGF